MSRLTRLTLHDHFPVAASRQRTLNPSEQDKAASMVVRYITPWKDLEESTSVQEVAVLSSPSLIVPTVSVDIKQH